MDSFQVLVTQLLRELDRTSEMFPLFQHEAKTRIDLGFTDHHEVTTKWNTSMHDLTNDLKSLEKLGTPGRLPSPVIGTTATETASLCTDSACVISRFILCVSSIMHVNEELQNKFVEASG